MSFGSLQSGTTECLYLTDHLLYRPQTHGEEELQLQLALAMSREEAEAEDSKKKSDDMRLQMAIQKSNEEVERPKVGVGCIGLALTEELMAGGEEAQWKLGSL